MFCFIDRNFSVNLAANVFHVIICFIAFPGLGANYVGGAWCVSATRIVSFLVMVFLIRRGKHHEATWPPWDWTEVWRDWGDFLRLGAAGAVMICAGMQN
jgi:Na+-driven multidrug efflux pump